MNDAKLAEIITHVRTVAGSNEQLGPLTANQQAILILSLRLEGVSKIANALLHMMSDEQRAQFVGSRDDVVMVSEVMH